jgi:DNA repair ATPase RecN
MSSPTGEQYGSRSVSHAIDSPFPNTEIRLSGEESEFVEEQISYSSHSPVESPFRSVYELASDEGVIDPEAEEAMEFLDELYDEEFDEALFELVSEAAELYEDRFESEYGEPLVQKMQAMRMLEQHFAPLVQEAETFLDKLAEEVKQLNSSSLGESELESFINRYAP